MNLFARYRLKLEVSIIVSSLSTDHPDSCLYDIGYSFGERCIDRGQDIEDVADIASEYCRHWPRANSFVAGLERCAMDTLIERRVKA